MLVMFSSVFYIRNDSGQTAPIRYGAGAHATFIIPYVPVNTRRLYNVYLAL